MAQTLASAQMASATMVYPYGINRLRLRRVWGNRRKITTKTYAKPLTAMSEVDIIFS